MNRSLFELAFTVVLLGCVSEASYAAPLLADKQSPQSVYVAYLRAIQTGNVDLAKSLWYAPPKTQEKLDLIVRTWVVQKQFNEEVQASFGNAPAVARLVRDDCTTAAIAGTINHVQSTNTIVTISNDTAKMYIAWGVYNESESLFDYNGEAPTHFRRIDGQWLLDIVAETETVDDERLDKPGSIPWLMKATMVIQQNLLHGLNKGQFKDADAVSTAWEREVSELKEKADVDRLKKGKQGGGTER